SINRAFDELLKALVKSPFQVKYLAPPNASSPIPPEIFNNPDYYPFFKNALGIIDGVHVLVNPPPDESYWYRNRK
ncbi:hypothetical protein SISSUDRAFT_974703, partial [Sistotremastrum suecicum HHB10207 ss-3]